MRRQILAMTAAAGGVIHRDDALRVAPKHVLDDAVAAGALVRLFPRTFVLPELQDDRRTRLRAAQVFRPDAALSHVDALALWGLPGGPTSPGAPVHLTGSAGRTNVEVDGVRLCRRAGFATRSPRTVVRDGLTVVRIEQAVVESWPMLPPVQRRAPAIVAVRERRTTAGRLSETLERQPRTAGAAEMRRLFSLLALGVHSELEVWGHERVFLDPRLPRSRAQVPVRLPTGRLVYLDRLYDEEMVVVELDGAAYHGSPGQRERDLRRDAGLAGLGYLTIRLSHPRLCHEVEAVIAELVDVLAIRRRQLGLRPA